MASTLLPQRSNSGLPPFIRSGSFFEDLGRSLDSRVPRVGLAALLVALFSVLYFTKTYFAAAEKTFWYDELSTLYISRFPTFQTAWAAVLRGADYNPPLFYIIHRAARSMFGEGLVAFRLPEILSFWVLGLCLFRFVNRRAGLLGGWIAMAIPALTGAYFYAFEARPHGLVLGFCGLALLCWDMLEEKQTRFWLIAFSVCLEAAFFIHCFALLLTVPFGLVELSRTIERKRIAWNRWLAIAVPAIVAVSIFVPLFWSYTHRFRHSVERIHSFKASALYRIPAFYKELLEPCILVVVLLLVVLVMRRAVSVKNFGKSISALIVGFIVLPLGGVVLARIVSAPLFLRYFVSAVVGIALLFGLGVGFSSQRWVRVLLAGAVACALGVSCVNTVRFYYRGWGDELIEPSTKLLMNTVPGNPLGIHQLLTSHSKEGIPVMVPFFLDFTYLQFYWPDNGRLYGLKPSSLDEVGAVYHSSRPLGPADQKVKFAEFAAAHPVYFVYGQTYAYPFLSQVASRGAILESFVYDETTDYFLAKVRMRPFRSIASQ